MRIKLNEDKVIKFNIDNIVGSSMDNLKGYFRFVFEDIEYGFPVEFDNNSISVKIPAFKTILNGKLMESLSKHSEVRVKGRMDIIANNDTYVCPWMGDVDIEIPVYINIQESKNKEENKINIKDIMEDVEKTNKIKESKNKSRFSTMLKEDKN